MVHARTPRLSCCMALVLTKVRLDIDIICTSARLIHILAKLEVWQRILPYAQKYGVRIIAMNLRGYAGSTPYTALEQAEVDSADVEVQRSAVRRVAREIAGFFVFVCQHLGIPAVYQVGGTSEKRGGFVPVAWSLTNMFISSMLGDPITMDDAIRSVLSPFWRHIIMYGECAVPYVERHIAH